MCLLRVPGWKLVSKVIALGSEIRNANEIVDELKQQFLSVFSSTSNNRPIQC